MSECPRSVLYVDNAARVAFHADTSPDAGFSLNSEPFQNIEQQLRTLLRKVVLIGVTANSTSDTWSTPYNAAQQPYQETPGVLIQAQMVSQTTNSLGLALVG